MIATPSRIKQNPFGRTTDGQDVTSHTLQNGNGMSLEVLDFGGVVRTLCVPDRDGRLLDVVLGYDDLAGYEDDRFYIGAAIGRYANRIGHGTFALDGKTYRLTINNGPNHLHGGERGFNKVMWSARPFDTDGAVGVVLNHRSPDGDEGYPGNLGLQITYGLSDSNVFSVEYRARTDATTPVNMTQHSYFNLSGEGARDVLDHELVIDSESFTEIDSELIPTGRLAAVEGTPLDFRSAERIGARIEMKYEQLRIAGGYDHNFVLSHAEENLSRAARVFSPATGLGMEVFTTEPGMQFYSGNFLDGCRGKNGHRYERRAGLCLETQHFPDSPNRPEFPSTTLRPGEELLSRTEFRFFSQ